MLDILWSNVRCCSNIVLEKLRIFTKILFQNNPYPYQDSNRIFPNTNMSSSFVCVCYPLFSPRITEFSREGYCVGCFPPVPCSLQSLPLCKPAQPRNCILYLFASVRTYQPFVSALPAGRVPLRLQISDANLFRVLLSVSGYLLSYSQLRIYTYMRIDITYSSLCN
jgi:hypothetical protein